MSDLLSRRRLLGRSAALAAGVACTPAFAYGRKPAVAVVGGGFAGASCARDLAGTAEVTLIEANATYTACPLSNLVIAGQRQLGRQQFSYAALSAAGVDVRHTRAIGVDTDRRTLRLADGSELKWDRLVVAPGIAMRWDALPGYSAETAGRMPHAWQAGQQTSLLRRQLQAMPDGGVVAMAVPDNPYRCPPGPYERASLISHFLQRHKPRSKLLVLDAKDRFSKQGLFRAAWRERYADVLEWQGRSDGATVTHVDAASMTLHTDFDSVRADVANVIPPQRAGTFAAIAGVADQTGWCPVDAVTFESPLQPGIHVIGDAAIANAMPKSAFAANAQARLCALQLKRLLAGESPVDGKLLNTCYSLVAPDHGISVAAVYEPDGQRWREVSGAGGVSPADASADHRAREARFAHDWFRVLTREVFA